MITANSAAGLVQCLVNHLPAFFSSLVMSVPITLTKGGAMYKDKSLWGIGKPERIEVCQPAALGWQLGIPCFHLFISSSLPPTQCQGGNILNGDFLKRCQASTHLQTIMSNLHSRSRRPLLCIWNVESSINMINGLGQLTASVATADPQALCT